VIKPGHITVVQSELTQAAIADGEIVPQDLNERNLAGIASQTPPQGPWDELPTSQEERRDNKRINRGKSTDIRMGKKKGKQ
jgi:hypothetical protein